MKGSNLLIKRTCSSIALLMVTVSAVAARGGLDLPLSGHLIPFREPAGSSPDSGFDPCLISPVFSGCISIRKVLKENQQALTKERNITGLLRALMMVKNEQSRRYIEALNDLNTVRMKLAECEVTRRTVGSAFSGMAAPVDLNLYSAGISRLDGDVRQVPYILLNDLIAYPDFVIQIRALRAENRSLRLGITEKDDQLATSQKEVERLVGVTVEPETRVKEREALSREDTRQQEPLTGADDGRRNAASGVNAAVEQVPLPASAEAGLPSGGLCVGRGLFTGGSSGD